MPHAEENNTVVNGDTTTPTMNGEKTSTSSSSSSPSQFKVISHLSSYPIVNASTNYILSTPYGQKSSSLLTRTYSRFIAPLHPYLATPYSYLSPYVERADELGDSGLSRVESRFPIVKEDTGKLKETLNSYALAPVQLIGQGKEYVLGTFEDEYAKTSGDVRVLRSAKALISTELRIGQEGYKYVSGFLGQREEKGTAEDAGAEKKN